MERQWRGFCNVHVAVQGIGAVPVPRAVHSTVWCLLPAGAAYETMIFSAFSTAQSPNEVKRSRIDARGAARKRGRCSHCCDFSCAAIDALVDHSVNRYFPAPSPSPVSSSSATPKAEGHQMSLLTAPVVTLLLFSAFSSAAITSPDCSATWEWSFNSLGQNACTVAAYMLSTCNGGSFTVNPLQPGSTYGGPSGVGNHNSCICSTVAYSLISACAGCQGEDWISWSKFATNCTNTLPPSSFPNPIPSGTRVPQWALLDVTNENFWNLNKSYATGDSPEIGPGTVLGASGSSASVSASTTGSSTTGSSTTGSSNTDTSLPAGEHHSNAGAIAGGVTAGIAAISILVAASLFFLRRRRSLKPIVVFEGDSARHTDQVHLPTSDQGMLTETFPGTMTPLKFYNPHDPTTYPDYQIVQPPPAYISDQMPSSGLSTNGGLYTVATPLSSQTRGYHGLPIV